MQQTVSCTNSVWNRGSNPTKRRCVWVSACQSNRARMSQVSCCAGISLSDTRWKTPRSGPARKRESDTAHASYSCVYPILFYSIFIYFLCFFSRPAPSPFVFPYAEMIMAHVCFLMHWTLFMVPLNNSALMEIFNIACWSPLGAVDGLLLRIHMWAGQVEYGKEKKQLVMV